MFESMSSVTAMALIAGLKFPVTASIAALAYCAGNVFFLKAYADTSIDAKIARYKGAGRLGALKPLGMVSILFMSCYTCFSLLR